MRHTADASTDCLSPAGSDEEAAGEHEVEAAPYRPGTSWLAAALARSPARARRSKWLWRVAAAGSLLLHIGLATALLMGPSAETGIASAPAEAYNVEISLTGIIEQTQTVENKNDAALSDVSPTSGNDVSDAVAAAEPETEVAPAEVTEAQPANTETPPAPEVSSAGVVSGQGAEQDISATDAEGDEVRPAAAIEKTAPEHTEPKPDRVEPRREPVERERKTEKAQVRPDKPAETKKNTTVAKPDKGEEKQTKSKGGKAVSGASQKDAKGSARAAASAGDVMGYAARVRARVASRRPGGAGFKGTAVVSFGVTSGGGLAYARLSRSSGNSALDKAALSAVRSAAPFPPPPAGASKLSFSVPFSFR